jgi:hypothetical protein
LIAWHNEPDEEDDDEKRNFQLVEFLLIPGRIGSLVAFEKAWHFACYQRCQDHRSASNLKAINDTTTRTGIQFMMGDKNCVFCALFGGICFCLCGELPIGSQMTSLRRRRGNHNKIYRSRGVPRINQSSREAADRIGKFPQLESHDPIPTRPKANNVIKRVLSCRIMHCEYIKKRMATESQKPMACLTIHGKTHKANSRSGRRGEC